MALALDSAGNVLLTGGFDGPTDLGGGPIHSTYDYDIFLAKYDPAGNHLWSKTIAGKSTEVAFDVAVDSADNVILSAPFYYHVDAGGGPIANNGRPGTFLAKLDSAGNHLWSRGLSAMSELGGVFGESVDVDSADNILLAGTHSGTVDLGGGLLPPSQNGDIFLAKYDPSSKWLANQSFWGAQDDEGAAVRMDRTGRAILTGDNATVDLGGAPVVHNQIPSPPGHRSFFVAWLDP